MFKYVIKYLLLLTLFLNINSVVGQAIEVGCGAFVPREYNTYRDEIGNDCPDITHKTYSTEVQCDSLCNIISNCGHIRVPVFITLINDPQEPLISTENDVVQVFNAASVKFLDANILFYLVESVGVNPLIMDDNALAMDIWNAGDDPLVVMNLLRSSTHYKPGFINIFITRLNGRPSAYIGSGEEQFQVVSLGDDHIQTPTNNFNIETMAHELGHNLGLWHTFSTQFNDNGQAGCNQDGIGDTSTDIFDGNGPIIGGEINEQCEWIPDGTILNYNPPIENLMSYYYAHNTCEMSFSPCQRSKMNDLVRGCKTGLCNKPSPPTVFSNDSYNGVQDISGETISFRYSCNTSTIYADLIVNGINDHSNTGDCVTWTLVEDNLEIPINEGPVLDLPSDLESGEISTTYHFRAYDVTAYNSGCASDPTDFYVEVLNENVDISDGLIAYYPFNGNANDESGNGNNGSVVGATLSTDRYGNAQSAYEFDGNSDYIICPSSNLLNSGQWTFSTWVLIRSEKRHSIYGEYNMSTDTRNYIAYNDVENGFEFDNFLPFGGPTHAVDIPLNVWHQLTYVFNGQDVLTYLNDIQTGIESYEVYAGANPIVAAFGSRLDGLNSVYNPSLYSLDGKLDDIRIYNRALNCNEIQALYDVCKVDLDQGLVAYYPFNGDANDASGNGHDGTAIGGASPTTDRFGNGNSAFHFDGLNDYVDLIVPIDGSSDWTISCWIYVNDINPTHDDFQTIVSSFDKGFEVGFFTATNTLAILSDPFTIEIDAPNSISENNHYFLTFNKRGDQHSIYKNGVLISSTLGGSNCDFTMIDKIGVWKIDGSPSPENFNGIIDDLRIYNRALNSCEVSELYNDNCIKYIMVDNQDITENTTIYARQLVELSGVSISGSSELTVKSKDLLISGDVTVPPGSKITLVKEDGCIDNIQDVEGNIYETVKIGDQVWMKENLRTTKFNDGSPIFNGISTYNWRVAGTQRTPAYCWYNNDIGHKDDHGALYNWAAVSSTFNGGKNICPTDWHVPSHDEFNELRSFLDPIGNRNDNIAGGKLKTINTWVAPNTGATNESRFSALPSGLRQHSINSYFTYLNVWTLYWTSTDHPTIDNIAVNFWLFSNFEYLRDDGVGYGMGLSVRCIKD